MAVMHLAVFAAGVLAGVPAAIRFWRVAGVRNLRAGLLAHASLGAGHQVSGVSDRGPVRRLVDVRDLRRSDCFGALFRGGDHFHCRLAILRRRPH